MTKNSSDKNQYSLTQISKEMADRLNLPNQTAYECTRCLFCIITDLIRHNKNISIKDFGVFRVKDTKERKIYIPSEGSYRIKPPEKRVLFKSKLKI